MRLNCQDETVLPKDSFKVLSRWRIDVGHNAVRTLQSMITERFSSRCDFIGNRTHRKQQAIVSIPHDLHMLRLERPVQPRNYTCGFFFDPIVDRHPFPPRSVQAGSDLPIIRGCYDAQSRLKAHHSNIFKPVMRKPILTIADAASDSHYSDRELVLNWPVSDEFVRSQRGESHNRINERNKTRFSQSGGDPDHVLLSHANINKSVRKFFGEWFQDHESKIGRQHDYPLVGFGQFGQGRNECFPHTDARLIPSSLR
jgi:hypothetical protein